MGNQAVDPGWAERMHQAAMDLEAQRQGIDAKVELRNQLVIEGIDSGYRIADVAQAAHVVPARVNQILAAHG